MHAVTKTTKKPVRLTATHAAVACVLALTVAGCSPSEDAGASYPPQLRVAEQYQGPLDEVWQKAEEGKAPSCGVVFGHANVALNIQEDGDTDEAMRAIEACYVHTTAHYFHRLLEPVKAGDADCTRLLTQGSIHRRAMRAVLTGMNIDTEALDNQLNSLIETDIENFCSANEASAILQHG